MGQNNQITRINAKLTPKNLNLNGLKTYIQFRFKSYREAGARAGISEGRVRQILIGYKIPQNPRLIHKIARGWDIDVVKLTQLFDSLR